MSFRQLTRRTAVLARRPYKAVAPNLYRQYVQDKRPYDPDTDPTPRRKYVFGAAALIAVTVGIISTMNRSVRADSSEYVSEWTIRPYRGSAACLNRIRRPSYKRRVPNHVKPARNTASNSIRTRSPHRVLPRHQSLQRWVLCRP
jgi:hypothetical protein